MKKIIICNLIIVLLFFILFNFIFSFYAFCINKPGKIFISSIPSRGKIYLNGEYQGVTPQFLSELSPNVYLLRLAKSGYKDYIKWVTVSSGKTTYIKADLVTVSGAETVNKPGKIFISSTPSGASVFLDGIFKGVSPMTLKDITIGKHMLKITKTGYHEYQKEITVSSDKTTEILANLYTEKTLATQQKEAEEWFNKAYDTKTLTLKIEYYSKALELDPKYTHAYNNRGNAYSDWGEYQKAIDDYNKAIELDPKYTHAYTGRGYAYSHLGEYQKAIDDYNEALELDPNYTLAYNNRGYAYSHLGEYQKAIDDYNRALELDPNYTLAYNNREIAIKKLDEYQNAKGAISLSSTPSSATIYLDGNYKGTTPRTIKDISPGSHTLKITKIGYEDWTKDVEVTAGKTTNIPVNLVALPDIKLTNISPGAQVYLDGEFKGSIEGDKEKNTFTLKQVPFGKHQIKVTKSGYQAFTKDIVVTSSTPLSLPVTLKKIDTIIPLLLALILPALAIIYYLFLLPLKKRKKKRQGEEKETIEDLPPIKKEDIPKGITEASPEQDKPLSDDPITREYQEIQEKMEEQAHIRTLLSQTKEKIKQAIRQAESNQDTARLTSLQVVSSDLDTLSEQFEYGKLPSEKVNNEVKLIKNKMKELSKKSQAIKEIKPKELNKKTREIREKKRE